MNPNDFRIEDIHVGEVLSFGHSFTEEDVLSFAKLSGDMNPLHVDKDYAASTLFTQRLVHGMFLGALCSRFVGMYLPGKRCLYLSQSLLFKKPVFIGDIVTVKGEVTAVSLVTRIVTISISITKDSVEVVSGEAKTQII